MITDFDKLSDDSRRVWRSLPARRRALVAGALLATCGAVAWLTLRPPSERWAVLFSGLAAEDAARVLDQLRAQSVPYRVEEGRAIEVPAARVHELRIALAASGVGQGGGVGFEVFDRQGFGTTSFVERMNYRRALQGELARTIMSLEAVEQARVLVAMRERSLYAGEDEPPSASVVLKLRAGRTLAAPQVRGIVNLVAASIEGMKPERVAVVDDHGAVLWSGDEAPAAGDDDGHRELERILGRRVAEMVERVVGPGHVAVAVTAEMESSRVDRTEELYDKDRVALRSESRSVERGDEVDPRRGEGGAGVQGPPAGAPAPARAAAELAGRARLSETRNYEVNRIISHTIGPRSRLRRLHVAVLVDEREGRPRAAAELERIASLCREAAGLDEERRDRIEVRSAPFVAPPAGEPAPAPPPSLPRLTRSVALAAALAVALTFVLVVLALGRRRRGEALRTFAPALPSLPAPVAQLEAALLGDGRIAVRTSPVQATRDRVLAAVRLDPLRASRVLSRWLSEAGGPSAGEPS